MPDKSSERRMPSSHDAMNDEATGFQAPQEILSHQEQNRAEDVSSGSRQSESGHHSHATIRMDEERQNEPDTSIVSTTSAEELIAHGRVSMTQREVRPTMLTVPSAENVFRRTSGQLPQSSRNLRRWDTMRLVELGSRRLHCLCQHSQRNEQSEIIEEESQMPSESGGVSQGTLSVPDVTSNINTFLSTIGWSPRGLWNALREEPGQFRYSVWIKSAFLTSALVLLYNYIRTLSIIDHLVNLYVENRERFTSHLDEFDECLRNAGWSNGFDSINKTAVVKVYQIFDAIMMDLEKSAFIGYLLGTVVGLRSLVTVLMQHKRMSLAISEALQGIHQETSTVEHRVANPWLDFQKRYPIMGSFFFLAVLCSTAIIQLHIVGILSSVLIGLIVNYKVSSVLMDEFGYYILAYLLVFVIEEVIMHFLKRCLISSDGVLIQHPRWFNFFMLVFSMVNLVLGTLFALWRLIYQLVTTLTAINRLDITLFTRGKHLDNGHNAFMSMLLLTVLEQKDFNSFAVHSEEEPPAEPVDI